MSRATRATRTLQQSGVAFTIHEYDYDPDVDSVGLAAASALGESPARVLKTLMARVDGRPVCAILPSDRELSMKKLAQALGGKSAQMMSPADAERLTAYKVGGISPFGHPKRVPVALEAAAMTEELVYVNGGQRGLQVRLAPRDIATMLGAVISNLIA